ncbi:MAG: hypothetical protein DRI57_26410 [Deltaproteobacteria bacterium]|nr:MAG: hypothetical protein DRI57_26410 [Deltaproteobacteria bacterium]
MFAHPAECAAEAADFSDYAWEMVERTSGACMTVLTSLKIRMRSGVSVRSRHLPIWIQILMNILWSHHCKRSQRTMKFLNSQR